ncbi:MAG: SMAD/FHA domain-containing protein [Monoraphidium minutum]|nr:MAG: SMAD/FHA domain-containing protein [Monoraphidium minutum]
MRPLFASSRSGVGRAVLARPTFPFAARVSAARGISRAVVVVASSRLVLNPTGSGSSDHIGSKVSMPAPIPLKDGVYEVGRSSPADILLPIPTVSTRHALLRVENDSVFVTDLNSTNGTMVNGQELSPMDNVEVEVGAEITFGDIYLARFQLDMVTDGSALGGPDGGGGGAVAMQDSGTLVMGGGEDGDSDQIGPPDGGGAPQRRSTQKRTAPRKGWAPY